MALGPSVRMHDWHIERANMPARRNGAGGVTLSSTSFRVGPRLS
jgi:hypothetical protein